MGQDWQLKHTSALSLSRGPLLIIACYDLFPVLRSRQGPGGDLMSTAISAAAPSSPTPIEGHAG